MNRLGPSGQVVFSDISQDLLDHCREAAAAEGLLDWCRFVLAAADSQGPANNRVEMACRVDPGPQGVPDPPGGPDPPG